MTDTHEPHAPSFVRDNVAETERLASAVRFTLEDHQRLLRKSDVDDICPSKNICFEYSDRVRCGPCAIRQSERSGVDVDNSLPFAPEQYRLQRRLKAAEGQIEKLREALEQVVFVYGTNNAEPTELRAAIGANIERYRDFVVGEPEATS
jgi:hypothetical protein